MAHADWPQGTTMLSDQQAQTVWFMTYELCDPRGETAALCSRQAAPKWEQ